MFFEVFLSDDLQQERMNALGESERGRCKLTFMMAIAGGVVG
jgi:hypothetical protein